jgi:hypothetical protein
VPLWIAALLLLVPAAAAQEGVPALAPGQARLAGDAIGTLRGDVVDARSGEGLADVLVQLLRPSGMDARAWPEPWAPESWSEDEELLSVRSAPDGGYRFDALPPGRYRVRIAERWLPDASSDAWIEPGGVETRRLELDAGAWVAGRVVDAAGEPMADIPIFVAGVDGGDGLNSARGKVGSQPTHSGADGSFVLRWVPPGTAYVQAGHRTRGYGRPVAVEVPDGGRVRGVELVGPDGSDAPGEGDRGGGVGVRLEFTPRGPVISEVIEGLPAAGAGLQRGDALVGIDGRSTRFMTSREFIDRCRGRAGTEVELTWVRGDSGPVDTVLVRASIADRKQR